MLGIGLSRFATTLRSAIVARALMDGRFRGAQ
jgi:hypothetical protein